MCIKAKFQSNIDYKRTRSKYQQLEKNILYLDEALLKQVCQDLSSTERTLFNALIYLSNHYLNVYVSQKTLANYLDMTRGYINRILLKLEAKGLVFSFYRHQKTCLYSIPRLFYQQKIRRSLSGMFSALRIFPLLWLTTINSMMQTKYDTQLDYLDYNILFTNRNCTLNVNSYYTDSKTRARRSKPLTSFVHGLPEKEEKKVELKENKLISEEIRGLTELNLTKWGQIKLSGFPKEAITYAKDQIKYANKVRNLYMWFFKICQEYCNSNGLTVNWTKVDFLKKTFHIPEDASPVQKPLTEPYTGMYARSRYEQRSTKNPNKGNAESKSYVAKPYKLQERDIDYEVEYHKYEELRKDPKHVEHLKRFNNLMGLPENHNPFSGSLTSQTKTSPPTTLRDTINTIIPRNEIAPRPMSHNSFQDIDEDADTEFEF